MTDFKGFFVAEPAPSLTVLGAQKVTAWLDIPIGPNDELRLWVGDQELDALSIDQFGTAVEGFIASVPDPNDTLRVQFPGAEKIDTALTATTEPDIV